MQDPLISALVVLRPASGRKVGGNETITSENVSDYLPDPENVRKTSAYFESVGFDVTSGTGPSFSISGARSVFERAFNQRIKVELKDDVVRSAKSDEGGLVLHLDAIPEDVARQIQEVTFEAPPDFGPFGH